MLSRKGDKHIITDFGLSGSKKGGMIWENSTETYRLPYVKEIASGTLMYDTGNPKLVLCDNLEGWGGEGGGRGVQEGGDTCMPKADLYWCMQKQSQYRKVIILQLK